MSALWWSQSAARPHEPVAEQARSRQAQLTKPPGSLGRLETLAIELATLQGQPNPLVDRVWISIFAADHGVVAEGVSAFPQSVTGEMLRNFIAGGAAINVLARELGASFELIDLGLAVPIEPLPGVRHLAIAPGTANLRCQPAMTEAQCEQALLAGRQVLLGAAGEGAHLFIGGEMGIGNTTAASALACALLDLPAERLVGPGTGLGAQGLANKARIVNEALSLHLPACSTPLDCLTRLGGLEIAALVGAFIAASQFGVPVLVDGFICSVAALCAIRMNPSCRDWLLFSHQGAEPGHGPVLAALDAEPLLSLGMRLGEGSGAALAVPLLRAACALHNQMATFSEAAISGGAR